MKAGQITAKLRDAVPVCFFTNGSEATRYKNIDIPDSLKELELTDFGFDVPADGKITFRLHFETGVLPAAFPPAREKLTRAEKAALKAGKAEEPAESDTGTAEPEAPAAEDIEAEAAEIDTPDDEPEADAEDINESEEPAEPEITETRFNVTGDRRKALAAAVASITGFDMAYRGAPSFAWAIGNYTVDKTGTLIGESNPEMLADLAEQGFTPDAE
jgi:hypothetical protein